MPDQEANDTKAQNDELSIPPKTKDAIADAINKKIPGSAKCNVCPDGSFMIGDHFVSLLVTSGESSGGTIIGGPTYPCVMLICGNCGHTRLHNAILLNVLPVDGQ